MYIINIVGGFGMAWATNPLVYHVSLKVLRLRPPNEQSQQLAMAKNMQVRHALFERSQEL